jgi:hypothetical protein
MDYMYNNATGDWTSLGGNFISGVTGYFGNQAIRDAKKAEANALISQGKSQVEVARIMQETEKLKLEQAKLGGGAKSGSTALYIGLGVGAVAILGVVIFAVTRKK